MSSKVDEHLNWLATQYVLGELSDADRDAFELRLADDLAACEAVTAASRFVLTARAALGEPQLVQPQVVTLAATTTSNRKAWLAGVSVSAAAALLCLFWLQVPSDDSRVAVQDPAAAELVSLWRTGVDPSDSEADDVDGELADDDMAVPGWMLAAVSFETDDAIEGPSHKVQEN